MRARGEDRAPDDRARRRASPGRPWPAMAMARAGAGSASPPVQQPARERLDRERRESQPGHARERRSGSSGAHVVGTEHEAGRGAGLLERLEERVLGVRVQPLGGADDGDAKAALQGRQREVGDELLDLPEADLLARALGRHEMEIGVVAQGDLAAGRTGPTGPAGGVGLAGTAGRRPGRRRAWSCRRRAVRRAAAHAAAARVRDRACDRLEGAWLALRQVRWPCPAGSPARGHPRATQASSGDAAAVGALARRLALRLGLLGRGRGVGLGRRRLPRRCAAASRVRLGLASSAAAGASRRAAAAAGHLGAAAAAAPACALGSARPASVAASDQRRDGRRRHCGPAGFAAGRLPACQLGAQELLDLRWDLAPWIAAGCLLDRLHGMDRGTTRRAGPCPTLVPRAPPGRANPDREPDAHSAPGRSPIGSPRCRTGRPPPTAGAGPAGAARRGGTRGRRARVELLLGDALARADRGPRQASASAGTPIWLSQTDPKDGVLGQGGHLVGEVRRVALRLCSREPLRPPAGPHVRAHGRAPAAPATPALAPSAARRRPSSPSTCGSAWGWWPRSAPPRPRESFSPGRATRPADTGRSSSRLAATAGLRTPAGRSVRSDRSGRSSPSRRRRRGVTPDSLSGTSVIERSPSAATRRPLRAPFSTRAMCEMSMKMSAASMRSLLVLPRKLMTSTRTPCCWTALMAGAKSPSPETTTAMSSFSAIRIMSTTSSMSRLALMRPSPYLRMSLLTTL